MNRLLSLAIALVFAAAPLAVRAQTIISSSYNGTAPGTLFSDAARAGLPGAYTGLNLGQPFSTGAQSYTFTSVVANMTLAVGSSSDLVAGIYSNNSGTPGTLLASLTVPAMTPLTQANYTFTTGSILTFAANSTYWFVVAPSTANTNLVDATWYRGTSGTGLATAALGSNGISLGSWVPDLGSAALSYQVMGSAIPEPSTYAAMAGALTLGFALWQRRRRSGSAAPITVETC